MDAFFRKPAAWVLAAVCWRPACPPPTRGGGAYAALSKVYINDLDYAASGSGVAPGSARARFHVHGMPIEMVKVLVGRMVAREPVVFIDIPVHDVLDLLRLRVRPVLGQHVRL